MTSASALSRRDFSRDLVVDDQLRTTGVGADNEKATAASVQAQQIGIAAVIGGTSGNERLTGTAGPDRIRGFAGNDTLNGRGGNDTLEGGSGNDWLDGGGYADSMTGGTGNDRYFVNNTGDRVVEAAGGGNDVVDSSVSFTLGPNVEDLNLIGTAKINGTGNELDNTLTGNDAANKLIGLAGNDTLVGGGGNDTLNGVGGADSMIGGSGNDIYNVDSSGDRVVETAGGGNNDQVYSFVSFALGPHVEHLDLIGPRATNGTGNVLNNKLAGNSAANKLAGLAGNDTLDGGSGNDTLQGGGGNDVLDGGPGFDTAVFAGKLADYEITTVNGVTTVVDLDPVAGGNDGKDTLVNVEFLQFADQRLPRVIDLSSVDVATGFIIQGDASGDWAGYGAASAGDVNGDGFDDLVIGAPHGSDGDFRAGEAYIVFGKADGFSTVDLSNLGSQGFIIQGDAASDYAGWSVASAGDVNGDGFDDLIVGATHGDDGGYGAGEAYVIFGKAGGFGTVDGTGRAVIDLTTLAVADGFIIQGDAAGDRAGISVGSAGDVNGDGFDDLIVGANAGDDGGYDAGEAYIVFGKAESCGTVDGSGRAVIDLTTLAPADGFIVQGDAEADNTGLSAASAGDVNGDGFDDVIVGSTTNEAYVIFGRAGGFGTVDGTGRAVIDLTTLAVADGFIIQGDDPNDDAGFSVASAGDVNGDGLDDLIVGAPGGDDGGDYAGEAYVVFGKAGGFATLESTGRAVIDLTMLAPADGFIIQGDKIGDEAGHSVASAGDVNGDGFDDLIVGAPFIDYAGSYAGKAYVVFGKAEGFGTVDATGRAVVDLTLLDVANGFVIQGDTAGDQAGVRVASAGDVNGDGFDDVIVGAFLGDDGGKDAGEAYVIFGGDFLGNVVFAGDSGDNTFTGTAAPETFIGAQGSDTLIGNGGADAFRGGEGDDRIVVSSLDFFLVDGDSGDDTLALDGAGLHLDLTTLANNRIQGIERIDITGTGANTLTLSVLDVLDLSDSSNALLVDGDAGDSANIGAGWTAASSGGNNGDGTSTIDGETFQIYAAGQATLLVNQDIDTIAV
jgi:hypothetical protein